MKKNRLIAVAAVALLLRADVSLPQQESRTDRDSSREQLDKIVFPTSYDSKMQPRFERAMALLHSFS